MKNVKLIIFILPLLAAAFVLSGCHRKAPSLAVGSQAPDFTLTDVNGTSHSLSSLRGKVVIVDFWATWCPPCQASIPTFNKLYQRFKDDGLVVMGVSIDDGPGSIKTIREFARSHDVLYTLLWDNRNVADTYNVESIPNAFIIDKNGIIRDHHLGFSEDEFDEISGEVQGLLK